MATPNKKKIRRKKSKSKKKEVIEPKKKGGEEKKEEQPKRSVWQNKIVQFFTAIFGVGVITFCTPMFDVVDDATGGFLTTVWNKIAATEEKFEEVNDDINNNNIKKEDNKTDWEHSESLAYPAVAANDPMFVQHRNYALLYNEKHEQAAWVAYQLKVKETKGINERHNNFKSDPAIVSESAKASDYKGSGYDRGHLAPASDFKFSSLAMTESFYMSNMSPQTPGFNRGIWKGLEDLVRRWVAKEEILYIATGPVLKSGLKKIGTANKISVPKHFYKIILKLDKDRPQMIAFLMPNKTCEGFYEDYVVAADEIEQLTGIDFFAALPNPLESKLEANLNSSYWFDQPESIPSPVGNLRILE